ncbi:MAG: CoA ligase [Ramlibacter sp.]|nr:CoA ligase [Ramlibacter sp.]
MSSRLNLPPLAERTFTSVIGRHVAMRPDQAAVRDPERSLSYGALYEEALAVAGGFGRLGVREGEAVLVMLDNHLDSVVAWWALALTRRVEVPVNTAYRGSILAHVANNSCARAIVIDEPYLPVLAEVIDQLPRVEHVIVRGAMALAMPPKVRVHGWEEIRGPRAAPVALEPWDLMGIMYTSGTTGPSKGVRVTQAHAYGYASPAVLGRAVPQDVSLVTLPLFHIGGQWAGVYNSLIAGGSSVVLPRFSATSYWDDVRRYGCTYTLMLGAMANFLYQQPAREDDRRHGLRQVLMVPVIAQMEAFCERFAIDSVATAYGLTEGSTALVAALGSARAGAVGVPRPDFDIRLVDEHDIEVPAGKVGELLIRPQEPWSVMDGYHKMPEATIAAWRNQWLHTGDAFRVDTDGQYVFVDRMKDAMRRRGENVSSFEVEKEIMEHPAVLEAAVIGVPSAASEDDILACVVLRPGAVPDADALLDFLEARLPYFMVPRYVDFLVELPKTPTAKVRKQELRARGVTPTSHDRPPKNGKRPAAGEKK